MEDSHRHFALVFHFEISQGSTCIHMTQKKTKFPRKSKEDRQPINVYLLVNMDGTAVGSGYLATYLVLAYSVKQARKLAEARGAKEGCDITEIGIAPKELIPTDIYSARVKRIHAGLTFDQDKIYLAFPEHISGGPAFRPTEDDKTTGMMFRILTPFSHKTESMEYRQALRFLCRAHFGKSKNQHALELEQPLIETAHPNTFRNPVTETTQGNLF